MCKTKKNLQKTNITIIGLEKRMTTYLVEKYTVSRCKDLIHVISKLFVKREEDISPYQCCTACYIMLSNSHQLHSTFYNLWKWRKSSFCSSLVLKSSSTVHIKKKVCHKFLIHFVIKLYTSSFWAWLLGTALLGWPHQKRF